MDKARKALKAAKIAREEAKRAGDMELVRLIDLDIWDLYDVIIGP